MSTLKRFAKPFWSYESGLQARKLIVRFEARKEWVNLHLKPYLYIFLLLEGERRVLWLQSNVKYESNRVELRSGHAIYERRFLVWIWRRKEKWRPWWLFLFVCVRHCLATGFSTNHNRPTQNASETCVYMTCRAFWKRSDKANWMQNTRIDKIALMRSFEITESGPLSRRFKPHFGKNKLRSKKMTSF